jgi:glycerol-3-phosphate O-acyltransferase/dihydroxyacetone phosphate acyltransferase
MLYALLRRLAGVALGWFYRDIEVLGGERIPVTGPLLIAANHPNALIDALVIGWILPRRMLLTAKGTLFEHPALRWLLRNAGVIPLRRASDERTRDPSAPPARERNAQAFDAILGELAGGGAVLIFPEGKSHSEPSLAPLRSGAARIALQARDERGVRGLAILPIGLTFERKWEPRSRVVVHVGEPLALDAWRPAEDAEAVDALVAEVDAALRAVTLNFPSSETAERVTDIARTLGGVYDSVRSLDAPLTPLADEVRIAQQVDTVRRALEAGDAELTPRAERLVVRLEALRAETESRGVAINDIGLDLSTRRGAWFVVRELALAAWFGPLSWWGRVNHWAPLRLARTLALRSSQSPEDPAMHTIVAGLALVLLFYAVQTALVWHLAGWGWGLLYLVSLPLTAHWDFRYRERLRRARQRVRTYLLFRREPVLRRRLCDEIAALREEAAALGQRSEERVAMTRAATTRA